MINQYYNNNPDFKLDGNPEETETRYIEKGLTFKYNDANDNTIEITFNLNDKNDIENFIIAFEEKLLATEYFYGKLPSNSYKSIAFKEQVTPIKPRRGSSEEDQILINCFSKKVRNLMASSSSKKSKHC